MSRGKLRIVTNLSIHTIQRTEQGLMPQLPWQIFEVLYDRHSFLWKDINNAIDEWKTDTRVANVEYLRKALEESQYWSGWLGFREYISESKAGFCKLYCIHPQALDNFEKPHLVDKRENLSPYLWGIFYEAGLTIEELHAFNDRLYYHANGLSNSSLNSNGGSGG
jgi:hypothetical protein